MSEPHDSVARQRLAQLLNLPAGEPARPAGGVVSRLGGTAFDPGRRGVRALAVIAVLVVVAAAGLAWWSRPRAEAVPPVVATPGAAAAAETVASPSPTELVVAVSGMVREPGLVHLPPGARVADAIEAAGGLLPDANVDQLNLARKVTDGELIVVGIPGPPGASAGPADPGGQVNLNTATMPELETLPGIGPALAQRIIDYRTEHGPFTAVEQLRQVPGIGEVRFAEIKDHVTI